MATVSFDKKFVISNPSDIKKILNSYDKPEKIKCREVNLKLDNVKGVEILARRFSQQPNSNR